MRINWLIFKNDMRRNRLINLSLLIFMIFSTCLAVLSAVVATQTFNSIAELYSTAQPPHFLQMHKGTIDQKNIDAFMAADERVISWQTVTMIDVYGESITIEGSEKTYDLSDCRLDIGLVRQNDSRDLLLDAQHHKVEMTPGGIGMPVILQDMYDMELGDRIILQQGDSAMEFEIRAFVLDAQMNSTMVSSTRILLSDEDFAALAGKTGEKEYLIEAYFADPKEASAFQTDYENAGLPQNGQAVTYAIIFLLSAFTDIVTVFVMLLASLLLVLIAFISVRFTIMAALEEEIGEIGTMKAIGFRYRDIRNLYMVKYRTMAALAAAAGWLLALMIRGVFTDHISRTFGDAGLPPAAAVLSITVAVLVFLLMTGYCRAMLRRIRPLTVVDALVTRKGFGKAKSRVADGLHGERRLPIEWAMGIRELVYGFRNWFIVFAVVLSTMMMILIPINLLNTMESPEFITYMGSSLEDILIEVENGDRLESSYAKARSVLETDPEVLAYYEYRRVRLLTTDLEGEPMNLHVDCGNGAGSALQYLEGGAPEAVDGIALSYLNAEKMGKGVGDTISVAAGDAVKTMTISGIYQDVTGGGFSAKTLHDFSELPAEKYTFAVDLADSGQADAKAEQWSEAMGAGVAVDPMELFIDQTLGGVVRQLGLIVMATSLIGACLALLITVLFLKLRLAKDMADIAVQKAIGFPVRSIRKQYMIKTGMTAFLGVLSGVILTAGFGGSMVNSALSFAGLGIRRVDLIADATVNWMICPLMMMALVLSAVWVISASIKDYNIVSMINE